jgi:hypothetical protein
MNSVTNTQDRKYKPKKEATVPRIVKNIHFARSSVSEARILEEDV